MPRVKVAFFNEIPEGDLKKVQVGEETIALYKLGGQIYATTNTCTHEQCLIDENHMMHNDVVECTCHGSQFDIKTGAVILPPAIESLKTYKVIVEGEDVLVDV